MSARVRAGACRAGGIVGYPLAALREEVAFIAYHFHWPPETIMDMEHVDRRGWVEEISAINQRINESAGP